MSIMMRPITPDPTAPRRDARQQARKAAVTRDAVIEALVQLVHDTMCEDTNALTLALRDTCELPPEDCWELDQSLKYVPYRTRAEVGLAFLRLCGEVWLHVASAGKEARF
jgi:hypothetical protein